MSVALALWSLADNSKLTRVELALAGQAAEHAYVGTMCDIIEQLHRIAGSGRPRAAHRLPLAGAEAVPLALPEQYSNVATPGQARARVVENTTSGLRVPTRVKLLEGAARHWPSQTFRWRVEEHAARLPRRSRKR